MNRAALLAVPLTLLVPAVAVASSNNHVETSATPRPVEVVPLPCYPSGKLTLGMTNTGRGRAPGPPLRIGRTDVQGDRSHHATRLLQIGLARRGDLGRPVRRYAVQSTEGTRDRAGHRRDRVRVPAVVRAAQDGPAYISLGHEHEAEGHRELLDRLRPARPAGVHRLVTIIGADCVVRLDRLAQRGNRLLPVCHTLRRGGHRLDGPPSAVLGQCQRRGDRRGGRCPRHHRGGDGGPRAPRPPPARSSTGAHPRDRSPRRTHRRVPCVRDADRRHVHRRTTVDDVADAGLARIDVPVVQPGDQPLLGQEHPLQQQCVGFQFGHPSAPGQHLRDQRLGDRIRIQMGTAFVVHLDQRVRHQRVVGDVPVALVVRRDRPGGAPVVVPRTDDADHPAAVPLPDRLRSPALDGSTDRGADEGTCCLLFQQGRHWLT